MPPKIIVARCGRIPGAPHTDAVVAGVPVVGEAEPRPLHLAGERLDGRTRPGENLHRRNVDRPKDEGQLEGMTGAEDPSEGRGLPVEQVHVGTRASSHVGGGQLEARPAEDDVRANGHPDVPGLDGLGTGRVGPPGRRR